MDSKVKLYLERAENELRFAKVVFNLSEKENLKIELGANPNDTFYSAVISHSYYAIFYSAKAMLLTKKIETEAPEVHKKTLDVFEREFISSGLLDAKLLMIYKEMIIRAEALLEIFKTEKRKRGSRKKS